MFPYRALYDPAADIPGQRAMLDQFYNSTGGATWFYLSASDNFRSQVAGLRDYVAAYQLAALTQNQTALQTYPPAVAQVLGQVSNGCTLQQELQLAQLTLKYPWYTPGTSYCEWFGVLCCLTIDISYAAFCTQGSQSVAGIRVTGMHIQSNVQSSPSFGNILVSNIPKSSVPAKREPPRANTCTCREPYMTSPCIFLRGPLALFKNGSQKKDERPALPMAEQLDTPDAYMMLRLPESGFALPCGGLYSC